VAILLRRVRVPFEEVWNEEKDAWVEFEVPSSVQYSVEVILSSSSQEGLGEQPVLRVIDVRLKLPSAFGVRATVEIFPEYEDT
jgi:hypothetical protein